MILVTHGIVGGAIGVAAGSVPAAIITGFISHFILDAIPHWDYQVDAVEKGETFRDNEIHASKIKKAILKVGSDGLLGILVPILLAHVFNHSYIFVLLGAASAILPDFLQFIYMKTKTKTLYHFMVFHHAIHSHVRLDKKPLLGISLQAVIWILAVVAMGSI